jgi:hypothetical protein
MPLVAASVRRLLPAFVSRTKSSGRKGEGYVEQFAARAGDVIAGAAEQNAVVFEFSKCLLQGLNGIARALVLFEQPTVAFDGAVAGFQRGWRGWRRCI